MRVASTEGLRCGAFALLGMASSMLVLAVAAPVRAEEPAERRAPERPLHLMLGGGYGGQDDSDAGSFGAALAFRGGVALDWLHLGAHGAYHVGSTFGDEVNRVHYYGAEVGGRFAHGRLSCALYVPIGIASVRSQRNRDSSFVAGYWGLGLLMDIGVVDWLTVGLDTRWVVLPTGVRQSDNQGALSTVDLLVMAGVRL